MLASDLSGTWPICLGDFLCRRFYRFVSVPHRCATAVLVGLLVSSWFTYLGGLAFARFWRPLLWGDALFFVTAIGVLSWPRWKRKISKTKRDETGNHTAASFYLPRPKGSSWADWALIAGYVVLVSWMMFASFNTTGSKLQISNPEYSDFGPNTAIMQSFAVGHNFPTEYPHFSGDRIRYHFLFYFQGRKSGIPRPRSNMEPQSAKHYHDRGDAHACDGARRGVV